MCIWIIINQITKLLIVLKINKYFYNKYKNPYKKIANSGNGKRLQYSLIFQRGFSWWEDTFVYPTSNMFCKTNHGICASNVKLHGTHYWYTLYPIPG